jgi:hypothetical protein
MSLLADSQALHAEMHELERDRQRFVLSPKAKARYEALPGLIADVHRRIDEEAQAKEAFEREFRQHYDGVVQQYLAALEAFVHTKAAVDQIRADARGRGIYLPKLDVMAHTDRELHALLIRARGTALA